MRKKITREMLIEAKAKGMNGMEAARHFRMHHSSVYNACERLGVDLPLSKMSPLLISKRSEHEASNERVKAWSASPNAIKRALAKI